MSFSLTEEARNAPSESGILTEQSCCYRHYKKNK